MLGYTILTEVCSKDELFLLLLLARLTREEQVVFATIKAKIKKGKRERSKTDDEDTTPTELKRRGEAPEAPQEPILTAPARQSHPPLFP